ncbi:malectin domain-containing carbohydrate-binding protein [Filimonas effusa]|uniref:DUF4982 domain-containing protein n=1 Tax=Filimonas effusa TaxID=2508721 RepID=A0A4Q1DBA0_9BACT|nr:malectin domain-containing carbohydrate-binding protein [Filimonas effusa]RXK86707.1 DUF4982 domain-containing protein [Filimonas effusa]
MDQKKYKTSIACKGLFIFILMINGITAFAQRGQRKDLLINTGWVSIASDSNDTSLDTLMTATYLPSVITTPSSALAQTAVLGRFPLANTPMTAVTIPHTWDKYEGYRQLKHGNRHGYAWYRKVLMIGREYNGKQLFLWFEGVNSFATIWVNGKEVGKHAGGRTSFHIDITKYVVIGRSNVVTVKAEHPDFIRTLPWVCGGCSEEQGFSEGSQPMGIFRPVHLIATSPIRIEPFGVHIWNDSNVTARSASIHTTTEVKNYTQQQQQIVLLTRIIDPEGRTVHSFQVRRTLYPNQTNIIPYTLPVLQNPKLWSLDKPVLYKAVSQVLQNGMTIDQSETDFGIRTVKWTLANAVGDRILLINNKPVFLNGISEYEHILGNSHALSDIEIKARAKQVKAAGFNAFRDAHQPHNLRYHPNWDSMGIAWWPQFAAHVWFDLPEFRENFKKLLRDWVKERRNSPSIVLWGLENESTLPEDFARECSDIIRELDPTASSQRKITTCNGGKGTDWDVPQNWTGTYGGDPADYGKDLIKQVLVGEYGAWRMLGLHTEGGFDVKGAYSEDRMTQLMEWKIRLADSVKLKTTGHFHWLLYSHDNPGRVQPDEGFRYLDKVGPVNYKGLITIWGEPTDAFYMYRSNYVSAASDPMVYIVSHTWSDRWLKPGIKSGITVYSNCEEVELFNDMEHQVSLGKRRRGGVGTHFQWDSVPVAYNVLYAQGYVNGKPVAKDHIVLQHLPAAPHFSTLTKKLPDVLTPLTGYSYLYRVNCGGSAYTDIRGDKWLPDLPFTDTSSYGYLSWGNRFPGVAPAQASQRTNFESIARTGDWPLFQTYRYGREQLEYRFRVPDGEYLVELYFAEPWYGIGGARDCKQWRVFDVAINGKTVISNLDIWKEAGTLTALKKTVKGTVSGGVLTIQFPSVKSSQAVIMAIAIAKAGGQKKADINIAEQPAGSEWLNEYWIDKGSLVYQNAGTRFHYVPALLSGDEWIKPKAETTGIAYSMKLNKAVDVYVGMDNAIRNAPDWLQGYALVPDSLVTDAKGGTVFKLYKKVMSAGSLLYLGKNGETANGAAQMYIVILHEPTAYETAEKIKRPVITYPAAEANLKGAQMDSSIAGHSGKGYAALHNISDRIVWTVTVGVGDTYELRFRYRTAIAKQIPVWLTVRSAEGVVMRHDKLFFAAADNKWKTLYSSTGTNINAGVYTVQLTPETNDELLIEKLDVQ